MKLYISEEEVLALPADVEGDRVGRWRISPTRRRNRDQSSAAPRDSAHRFGSSLHGRRDAGLLRAQGVFGECENRCAFRSSAYIARATGCRWRPSKRIISGQIRTGAASGVATKYLSRADASVAANHRQRISGRDAARGRRECAEASRSPRLEPQAGEARRNSRERCAEEIRAQRQSGREQHASAWKARISW